MKKLGPYTFTLLVTLAASSFIAPIINARFFINGGTANYNDEVSIDSAYFGNYRITEHHQLGIDRFIADDGKPAMLISDYSSGAAIAVTIR